MQARLAAQELQLAEQARKEQELAELQALAEKKKGPKGKLLSPTKAEVAPVAITTQAAGLEGPRTLDPVPMVPNQGPPHPRDEICRMAWDCPLAYIFDLAAGWVAHAPAHTTGLGFIMEPAGQVEDLISRRDLSKTKDPEAQDMQAHSCSYVAAEVDKGLAGPLLPGAIRCTWATQPRVAHHEPRLFIVEPSGAGYELLSPNTYRGYHATKSRMSQCVIETHPAADCSSATHRFTTQVTLRSRALMPLPTGEEVDAVAGSPSASMPTLLPTSQFVSAALPSTWPYMPMFAAQYPPAPELVQPPPAYWFRQV